MIKRIFSATALSLLLVPLATAAHAHTGHDSMATFGSGLAHPLGGLDHLLAMLAVGIWAAQAGGRNLWLLPAVFVTALAAGAALGVSAAAMPAVEIGIAASLALLGTAIFLGARLPLSLAIVTLTAFGSVHGLAHGAEMPATGSSLAFFAGMVAASLALHGLGMGVGLFGRSAMAGRAVRLGGIGIAGAGLLMIPGVI